jgi:serine/threonine protein kinase
MPVRDSERAAIQDAMELAVLSSVQHPNIVSVYACLTDMVESVGEWEFGGVGGGHGRVWVAGRAAQLLIVACGLLQRPHDSPPPAPPAGCAPADVDGSFDASLSGPLRIRYRRLAADEDPDGEAATFNLVVMEVGAVGCGGGCRFPLKQPVAGGTSGLPAHRVDIPVPCSLRGQRSPLRAPSWLMPRPQPTPCPEQLCDRGTLRDAIRGGLFHRRLPGGAVGVDLAAACDVLLDVACAVSYLHSLGLVHGDIKVGARCRGGVERTVLLERLRVGRNGMPAYPRVGSLPSSRGLFPPCPPSWRMCC